MHKLQIFVYKSQGSFHVGLVRHPQHCSDGVMLTPPLPSSQAYEALKLWESRLRGKFRLLWWQSAARKYTERKVEPSFPQIGCTA